MSTPDDTDWDLEPEYGRNGAPWVRRLFGPLVGLDVKDAEHRDADDRDAE